MSQSPPPLALIPADAPFSEAQRAWLNGFFNALLTQPRPALQGAGGTDGAPPVAGKTITLLYASQTGTAESWSKKFAKRLKSQGMAAHAKELQSTTLAELAKQPIVLVLASTYGEGDAPDSCGAFAATLAAPGEVSLQGVKYAVLALGDRNYVHFCAFGHAIDRAFEKLGGERLYAVTEVDNGADATWKSWQDAMLGLLPEHAGAASGAAAGASTAHDAAEGAADEHADEDAELSVAGSGREHPFGATLLSNRRLNHPDSDKETRHIVLSLAGAAFTYQPGDALGVWPRNPADRVEALLCTLGCAADALVMVHGRALSLREVLFAHCEISRMTTAVVLRFARHVGDAGLIALCEADDSPALAQLLHGLDACALCQRLMQGGAQLTAQSVVDLLAPLAPRLYSISSSPKAHPEQVHLTVALARFATDQGAREGLASAFLAQPERLGSTVPVYVHRNARFRLPADAGVPIIMIGPGTGIAPFRSFLEERQALQLTGRTWLFFGDRHEATDFLYREQLEAMLANGTLSRLDTAWSRDTEDKVYVQQRMLEASEELWSWLVDGAVIYVCGDASRMAKDVDSALQSVLVKHGHLSAAQAQLELRHWSANGRYLRDVY